jgi:histone H3/H4
MSNRYIRPAAVRRAAKEAGKRVSKEYLEALDRYVGRAIERALAEHNGGRKTLCATIAAHTLGAQEGGSR